MLGGARKAHVRLALGAHRRCDLPEEFDDGGARGGGVDDAVPRAVKDEDESLYVVVGVEDAVVSEVRRATCWRDADGSAERFLQDP